MYYFLSLTAHKLNRHIRAYASCQKIIIAVTFCMSVLIDLQSLTSLYLYLLWVKHSNEWVYFQGKHLCHISLSSPHLPLYPSKWFQMEEKEFLYRNKLLLRSIFCLWETHFINVSKTFVLYKLEKTFRAVPKHAIHRNHKCLSAATQNKYV